MKGVTAPNSQSFDETVGQICVFIHGVLYTGTGCKYCAHVLVLSVIVLYLKP